MAISNAKISQAPWLETCSAALKRSPLEEERALKEALRSAWENEALERTQTEEKLHLGEFALEMGSLRKSEKSMGIPRKIPRIPWDIPKTHGKCREIPGFSWKNAVFIGGKYVGRWIYVGIFVPLGWASSSPDLYSITRHIMVI